MISIMGIFDKFFKKREDAPEIIPEEVVKADIEKAKARKESPVVAQTSIKKVEQTKKDHFEYKTKRCEFCGRKVEAMDMSRCGTCGKELCEMHAPAGRHNCKTTIGMTMRKV